MADRSLPRTPYGETFTQNWARRKTAHPQEKEEAAFDSDMRFINRSPEYALPQEEKEAALDSNMHLLNRSPKYALPQEVPYVRFYYKPTKRNHIAVVNWRDLASNVAMLSSVCFPR